MENHRQRLFYVGSIVDELFWHVIFACQFIKILIKVIEQANQVTRRTRTEPIVLDVPTFFIYFFVALIKKPIRQR